MAKDKSVDPAKLMEELRRDIITAQIKHIGATRFIPYKPDIDVTVPVFFFDNAFDSDSAFHGQRINGKQVMHLLHQQAQTAFEKDQFILPFPQCFFIHLCGIVDTNNPRMKIAMGSRLMANIVYCDQDPETHDIELTSFSKFPMMKHWVIHPWAFHMSKDDKGFGKALPRSNDTYTDDHIKGFTIDLRADVTAVMVGVMLLNQPKAVTQEQQMSPIIEKTNIRRAQNKQKPVSHVTIINISDKVTLSPPQEHHVSSSSQERVPHDRRGHKRRYKNGMVIDIRPSKIHGGSDKSHMYVVKT